MLKPLCFIHCPGTRISRIGNVKGVTFLGRNRFISCRGLLAWALFYQLGETNSETKPEIFLDEVAYNFLQRLDTVARHAKTNLVSHEQKADWSPSSFCMVGNRVKTKKKVGCALIRKNSKLRVLHGDIVAQKTGRLTVTWPRSLAVTDFLSRPCGIKLFQPPFLFPFCF